MSIYVTGDIHGFVDYMRLASIIPDTILTKEDFIIILGDFGVLWDNHQTKAEHQLIGWLNARPYTILFLDGNHENFTRLNKLPTVEKFGGVVGKLTNSIYHLKRGEVYTICGKKILTIGGALSIDKRDRIEGLSWWREEELSFDEQEHTLHTIDEHQHVVDIILAHTLPYTVSRTLGYSFGERPCSVAKFLDYIVQITQFKEYYCGHFHTSKQISKYTIVDENFVKIA
jgi:hypothetical protein